MSGPADGSIPDEPSAPAGVSVPEAAEAQPADDQLYADFVFGSTSAEGADLAPPSKLKTSFAAWHHPVKQIVREYQWAELTRKLMEEKRPPDRRQTLRYFTLPGADLLDVRLLGEALEHVGTQIEYFGFDVGQRAAVTGGGGASRLDDYLATESLLRQARRITDNAEILGDRLEDIAQPGTQAANRLNQRSVFDVINIDACDHLGFVPESRGRSVFDALETLLAHQLRSTDPWMLFITTRADPDHLGAPATKLQGAIHSNLSLHQEQFGKALAACLGTQTQTLAADLASSWASNGTALLKMFSVGLGKFLLQFYHAQHNLPADVELVSVYAYKVHTPQPDMLSLAFRITPRGLQVRPPTAGAASVTAVLELKRAIGVAGRAAKLWDLDAAIADDADLMKNAVEGTERLLRSANYDMSLWRKWLAGLALRPILLEGAIT